MQIKIERYTKFQEGKVKGVADISIGIDNVPLTIRGVKVIENSQGGMFYAMPDKKYQDKEGNDAYTPICAFFTKDGYKAFHETMNAAFTAYFKSNNTKTAPVPEPVAVFPKDDDLPF